jgi:hypothetical protein
MMPLAVDAATASLLEGGRMGVVLAPGAKLPDLDPLLLLELRDGILTPLGAAAVRPVPLPSAARLLAVVAPTLVEAGRILPLLPDGVRTVTGADPLSTLVTLLAARLEAATEGCDAAEAARDAALRALGGHEPPVPERILEVAPGAAGPPNVVQPLGRPAEGLCTVELHLREAEAGAASLLRVRLIADGRIRGAWAVPGTSLSPGWIALDLPEPARLGAADAFLEAAVEARDGDRILLSAADGADGPLAMRLWTAKPGRNVLPLHFDWASLEAPVPEGLPLALPEAALQTAEIEGGTAHLVAIGAETPKLLVRIAPGGDARLVLPYLPAGPADLLRTRLACTEGDPARIEAALTLASPVGTVASGSRQMETGGVLAIALPLPGGAARPTLALRNHGDAPAVVELSRLVLMAGAAGERRRAPPRKVARPGAEVSAAAIAVVLPDMGFRVGAPQPPLAAATAGALAPAPAAAPTPAFAAGGTSWQDLKLQQHMVSADGGYRHLEMVISGLVAEAGLWRQVRTKLFERRGIVGLEFREAKGWPQMFDTWPSGGQDGFGPFWRLETERTSEALSAIGTPHDRALILALIEGLPSLAARASGLAGLETREAEAWQERARRLAAAVAAARPARRGSTMGLPGGTP